MRSLTTAANRTLVLTLAVMAGGSLVGCDNNAEASRSLQEAQTTLTSLHAGANPPAEFIESTNRQIRQTLAPALSNDDVRGAAKLIEGQTHIGDAEAALKKAERLETQAGELLGEAQVLATRLYAWRHARADASGSYSPDASVSDIDGAIREAQQQRSQLIEERERVASRLTQLERARDAARDEVRSLREQEVTLRDRSLQLDGDARLAAIQDAYDAQRGADAVLARASDLEAQAAELRPTREELNRRIDGAEGLVELLRASRESMQERGARQARTAQVDREQANIAASDLRALLDELHAFRNDELEPAYEAAQTAYGKANSSLRAASSDGASGLWVAAAQHGRASLALLRSGSAARYAEGLDVLAQMEPRLPFAGELQSRSKEASDAAVAFASDANDAYQQAASGYSRAARGPHSETLSDLADRLERRARGGDDAGGSDAAGG